MRRLPGGLLGDCDADWFGGAERQVLVILAAMPTAVSSFVLAEQMNSDADLAASSVVVSTAASMLTLTALLFDAVEVSGPRKF